MPPTVTVDAGPFNPGVKPSTTPGVLVRAGGGAGAAAAGGGGGAATDTLLGGGTAAGAVTAEPMGALEFDDGAGRPPGAVITDAVRGDGDTPVAGAALDELDEEALYAPGIGPMALAVTGLIELDIITGPGPSGTVFAIGPVEFMLVDGAAALGGGRFNDAARGLMPAVPGEPFVVKGTHARFDLLLAWMTTLLPPRKAGASLMVERKKSM